MKIEPDVEITTEKKRKRKKSFKYAVKSGAFIFSGENTALEKDFEKAKALTAKNKNITEKSAIAGIYVNADCTIPFSAEIKNETAAIPIEKPLKHISAGTAKTPKAVNPPRKRQISPIIALSRNVENVAKKPVPITGIPENFRGKKDFSAVISALQAKKTPIKKPKTKNTERNTK